MKLCRKAQLHLKTEQLRNEDLYMTTRQYWIDTMTSVARPVLSALANGKLVETMNVSPARQEKSTRDSTYLEAYSRTLVGIAPWLEHKAENADEEALRAEFAELARKGMVNAVTPGSPDELNFEHGHQAIVDAAFLAEAILRAPRELYEKLDPETKSKLIVKMRATRSRKPYACNWLLFPAMIEAFLRFAGQPDWDRMRIDYALRQHMQWYKGDSVYGDGDDLHVDYYNSFVIQPMLVDLIDAIGDEEGEWRQMRSPIYKRAARYASILEMLIAPDGTYPVVGRSVAYRYGAFHALSAAALGGYLEEKLSPASVRCALTAVIRRIMSAPNIFDKDGWLNIGVYGHQPRMSEHYISTGSLYLCSAAFLPLGLPESHPFWSDPDEKYTSERIWSGEDTVVDHAM